MTEEVFKPIKGYEGIYEISNLGRVKSLERTIVKDDGINQTFKERILIQTVNSKGYASVGLCKNKRRKTHTIHKLVAMAFLNHKPNGFKIVIDHRNNNPLDNRVENLQLISNRENASKDRKGGTSKYTGVSWIKSRNKWGSSIYINGKSKFLGRFTSELEAHQAYQKALNSL